MSFDGILGQPGAIRALSRAIKHDRVASAYLFDGPSGVGKQQTALAFAKTLVGGNDALANHRIDEGHHPDVRVFRPRDEGSHNIKVDFVRTEILPLAQYAPFEADRSVFVFVDADVAFPDNHPQAANTLLKTLEESNAAVSFVLTASRPKRLLSTIRSRAQRIRFTPLTNEDVIKILVAHDVDRPLATVAASLAAGRADVALALAADDQCAQIVDLAKRVHEAARKRAPGTITVTAEAVAKHPSFPLPLMALQTLYRDMCCASLGVADSDLRIASLTDSVAPIQPQAASARVALISEHLTALELNANRQLTMDALIFGLADTR